MKLLELYTQQLLWGESFLQKFSKPLQELYSDEDFMSYIESIQKTISVSELSENIEAIKQIVKKSMYETRAANQFPALESIVNEVANANYAKNSAYISVYFAMRIFALSDGGTALNACEKKESVSSAIPNSEYDFRLKWPAEYRCEDGHYVRSKNEMLVDNWLYSKGICHAYETAVFSSDREYTYCSDFFIPGRKMFIEIWGMNDTRYEERRKRKKAFYQQQGLQLMEINGNDVKNLYDKLSATFCAR